MADRRSFLIDTNIVIPLEDERPVATEFAEIMRRCSAHNVRILVHEASQADIRRDRDTNRRETTLSKLGKFEMLKGIPLPPEATLVRRYGSIASDNDRCDVALLHAVDRNVADFLVTQDNGIHRRAQLAGLEDRVFRVQDAVEWLRRTYDPKAVALPYLVDRRCYELNPEDPIFVTLREDYPDFDTWFRKVQHRPCWVLEVAGETAGILIRKDEEPRAESDATLSGDKILKIATFKVSEKFRGEKFGEHLLKQVLWYAQRNRYDLIYVTAFPSTQAVLIDLLTHFGFRHTSDRANGEAILEKQLGTGPLTEVGLDVIGLDVKYYPRFVADERVDAYCIPIQPRWYRVLYPENEVQPELPFEGGVDRTPGNTIRKVYLCRTQTKVILPGSILLFYVSGDAPGSGQVRTVGIVERMQEASDAGALLRLTGRRSVYSDVDQVLMAADVDRPVKVIDFLLVGHLDRPMILRDLIANEILSAAPQSIVRLKPGALEALSLHARLGFGP